MEGGGWWWWMLSAWKEGCGPVQFPFFLLSFPGFNLICTFLVCRAAFDMCRLDRQGRQAGLAERLESPPTLSLSLSRRPCPSGYARLRFSHSVTQSTVVRKCLS